MTDSIQRDLDTLVFSGILDVKNVGQVVVLTLDTTDYVREVLAALGEACEANEAEIADRLREFAWRAKRASGLEDGMLDPKVEETDAEQARQMRDEALVELLRLCELYPPTTTVPLLGLAAPTLASLLVRLSTPEVNAAHLRLRNSLARTEPADA